MCIHNAQKKQYTFVYLYKVYILSNKGWLIAIINGVDSEKRAYNLNHKLGYKWLKII